MDFMSEQSESEAPGVPKEAIRGARAHGRDWTWVEACVWNERMLAALGNGVTGIKRFSCCWPHEAIATLGRFTMIGVPMIASQSRC